MEKKEIRHITNRHYKKLTECSKGFIPHWDVEAIHQFRVEYKKLRAFLRMISGTGEIKIPGNLKKAYHIVGSVRDLQLQEQRTLDATKQAAKKPRAYLHLLQEEKDRMKLESTDLFSDDPVQECKKKTNASIPDEYLLSSFREYIAQEWAAIYSILLSGHFSDDHIHQVRKHLKDLFYNYKVFEEKKQDILPQDIWKGKTESYFDRLLDELGNFQDRCTALALLKPFWLQRLNKYNRDYLQRIKEIWIKDKMNIKKLLIRKLRSDFLLKANTRPADAIRRDNLR